MTTIPNTGLSMTVTGTRSYVYNPFTQLVTAYLSSDQSVGAVYILRYPVNGDGAILSGSVPELLPPFGSTGLPSALTRSLRTILPRLPDAPSGEPDGHANSSFRRRVVRGYSMMTEATDYRRASG